MKIFGDKKLLNINLSLKWRLILGFTMIVLLMGAVSVATALTLRNSITKLNQMVETNIIANGIINASAKIPDIATNYYIYRDNKYKKEANAIFAQVATDIAILKKYVEDDTGLISLGGLEGTIATYQGQIDRMREYIRDNKAGDSEDFIKLRDDIKVTFGYVKENAWELMAIELNNYHEYKVIFDHNLTWTIILIFLVIILVGTFSIAGGYIYSDKMVGVVSQLAHSAQSIADGNLQLEKVNVKSLDEIGILVNAFNKMAENLRILIGGITDNSVKVAEAAEFLKTSAAQSARASEQIASTIQQVSQGAAEQSGESQKTVAVVNQLFEGNKLISHNALKVLATSEQATTAALSGNEKVSTLINQINIIENEITSVQIVTETLKKFSDEIGQILEAITEMSSQTNLLALNASIEAARAGEYGKGFAVVAEEVRLLADGSAKAVKSITEILKKIQHQSLEVVTRTMSGVATVREGTIVAEETRIAFNEIVSTSRETDEQIKEITKEIQIMVEEIKNVEQMSESIAAIAEQSSAGSQEVAASAEEQTASLEEILASASMLSNMAVDLQKMVQQFKL